MDSPDIMRTRDERQARRLPRRTTRQADVCAGRTSGRLTRAARDGQGTSRAVRVVSGRAAGNRAGRARGSSPATPDGAVSARSPPDPPPSRSARGAPRTADRRARRYRSWAASAPPSEDRPRFTLRLFRLGCPSPYGCCPATSPGERSRKPRRVPSLWPAPDEHLVAARLYLGVNERYAAGLEADLGQ